MKHALEALLAVLIAALALPPAAVGHRPLPPGPDDAAVAAYNEQLLDATWAASSLSEIMERPVVPAGELLPDGDWEAAIFSCLTDAGYPGLGVVWNDDGALVALEYTAGSAQLKQETQLAFFLCVAAHPRGVGYQTLLTDDQIEYRYDLYRRWLVPCLLLNGYSFQNPVPSHDEFLELGGQWSPYLWGIVTPDGEWADTQLEYDAAEALCGPDWPGT